MIVIFVHGWSVTDTNTYGLLPEAMAKQSTLYGLDIEIKHLWLGRYISFNDTVNMGDIVRAFDSALRDVIPEGSDPEAGGIAEFSCITHSTGGPVVREWLDRYYGSANLSQSPLRHLIMLAPANHGSPLAALGKQRVGRIKAWFDGVEPGQLILNWLSLGSQQQIDLSTSYLDYKPVANHFYPFVLTGQSIDKKFYDFVNSYLAEPGSDGVVRVSGANMNFTKVKLVESDTTDTVVHGTEELEVNLLKLVDSAQRPEPVALGVIPNASHSGKDKGIMRSIISDKSKKPQLAEILKCLQVDSAAKYKARKQALAALTQQTQKSTKRYSNLVFVLTDDQSEPITDYDIVLLGGQERDPNKLTKGFFVDRQKNAASPNHLIYYINYDVIIKSQLTGIRIIARPTQGFSFYHAVEYRFEQEEINTLLQPNETLYVSIEIQRRVDQAVFLLDEAGDPKLRKEGVIFKHETRHDFKNQKVINKQVD
ncbi:hypothetical protein [Photobacterium rosenbergii]|uniref:Phospholipase n=1 Tax=Photobacterium rosenbergii TaxID=294936 RepID=A0ABU3ZBR1_9GAMM|nr:hypothetical protein [Photobacterium rosenbergii]MDV5167408.1 hypothetical protein [Photobacterium rosenbergii]